ncbi:MAG: 1-acyl-sn-glycerol-3-phosphate acyltransferase [Clostridia bacterium]|nr:1-acyl-sn-glycerol-3-phosphate acyltransferase [Clostridia bacterium]
MKKQVRRVNKLLFNLAWAFYGKPFAKRKINLQIEGDIKGLKPPFILMANHTSFADLVATVGAVRPHVFNTVVSASQVVRHKWVFKQMGVIAKRQFSSDYTVIKQIKSVLTRGGNVFVYPEGKLSVDGRPNPVQPAFAKMVKMLNVPLVSVMVHGGYLFRPRWSLSRRKVTIRADVKVLSLDEIKSMTALELNQYVQERFATVNDYKYQRENKIEINPDDLAEGLHTILYHCPKCNSKFALSSAGNKVACLKCGMVATMDEYGELSGKKVAYDKVADWYDWQREQVKKEVQQDDYTFSTNCFIQKLDERKGFKNVGNGSLWHNKDGFTLVLPDQSQVEFPTAQLSSLSFEADCLYLSCTLATYKVIMPEECAQGQTAYLNLAVEELFKLQQN